MAEEQHRKSANPAGNSLGIQYYNKSTLQSFQRCMFVWLSVFCWFYHPSISRVAIDDTTMDELLLPSVESVPCPVKDFLFTHGEVIKTTANGASRSSFKAEWFPSVFDIETTKAFRLLINYCFHRGNHNKWFVSWCLTKITTGKVNGTSNLHSLPTEMDYGK